MGSIVLADVSYGVPGRVLLDGITVTLAARRVGIVGRNGSGKTTLLRLISGLVAPSSGRVRLGGVDPYGDRKAALARVGILFQNPDHQILFPTVEEELAFGLSQMGVGDAMARARARLAAEGRADWGGRAVSTLSHGQKQWLCLQAVLLMGPETILLDEPFAALDLPTEARLRRQLAGLPHRLVTIAHKPGDLAGCDEILWLEAGRVAGFGPPDQVLPTFTAEMARLGAEDLGAEDLGADDLGAAEC
jgi:biotin transport system ATP-binding protein